MGECYCKACRDEAKRQAAGILDALDVAWSELVELADKHEAAIAERAKACGLKREQSGDAAGLLLLCGIRSAITSGHRRDDIMAASLAIIISEERRAHDRREATN